jgi:hypothetical protein
MFPSVQSGSNCSPDPWPPGSAVLGRPSRRGACRERNEARVEPRKREIDSLLTVGRGTERGKGKREHPAACDCAFRAVCCRRDLAHGSKDREAQLQPLDSTVRATCGRTPPGSQLVAQRARVREVSLDWLRWGPGEAHVQ